VHQPLSSSNLETALQRGSLKELAPLFLRLVFFPSSTKDVLRNQMKKPHDSKYLPSCGCIFAHQNTMPLSFIVWRHEFRAGLLTSVLFMLSLALSNHNDSMTGFHRGSADLHSGSVRAGFRPASLLTCMRSYSKEQTTAYSTRNYLL